MEGNSVRFIELYNEADSFIKSSFRGMEGVSSYLSEMEKLSGQDSSVRGDMEKLRAAAGRAELLSKDGGAESAAPDEGETAWLQGFVDRLRAKSDPLSVHQRSAGKENRGRDGRSRSAGAPAKTAGRKKSTQRNYNRDLASASSNCLVDLITAAAAMVASGTALGWTAAGGRLPDWLSPYRIAAASAALSALLYFLMKTLSSASDLRACEDIKKMSVYAVRLKPEQQKLIARVLAGQSSREHFTCYACVLAVMAVLLTVSYIRSGNVSSLLVLAVFAVSGLAVTLISYVRDLVRSTSSDGFCTVSPRGIIQAGRVFPFRAANSDVSEIVRFDDYYSIRFITPGVLGIMVNTDFPLPRGGSVSREMIGAEEGHVLVTSLSPGRIASRKGGYRYMPRTRQEKASPAQEELQPFAADGSTALRVLAWISLAALAVSVAVSFLR